MRLFGKKEPELEALVQAVVRQECETLMREEIREEVRAALAEERQAKRGGNLRVPETMPWTPQAQRGVVREHYTPVVGSRIRPLQGAAGGPEPPILTVHERKGMAVGAGNGEAKGVFLPGQYEIIDEPAPGIEWTPANGG